MKLHHKLFLLLLIVLPGQLGYHFWPNYSSVYGVRVDYLSPTVYLTDLLLLVILVTWFFTERTKLRLKKSSILFFVGIAALNIVVSANYWFGIYVWLRLVLYSLFSFYVYSNRKSLRTRIPKFLLLGSLLSLFLFLSQFVYQRSLGGLWYFLGERSFDYYSFGLKRVNIGSEFIVPFSSFSHPNSLSGYYLVVFFIFLFFSKGRIRNIGIAASLVLVFGSVSVVGIFGLLIGLFFYRYAVTKKLFFGFFILAALASLVLPVLLLQFDVLFVSVSLARRYELALISLKMFSDNCLFGVGLNNFILTYPRVFEQLSSLYEMTWFLQPVHNVYLLFLNYFGLFGLLVFMPLATWFIRKVELRYLCLVISLLFVFLFDHYFLTLIQNIVLLFLVLPLLIE